jgi:hypothetical protein
MQFSECDITKPRLTFQAGVKVVAVVEVADIGTRLFILPTSRSEMSWIPKRELCGT